MKTLLAFFALFLLGNQIQAQNIDNKDSTSIIVSNDSILQMEVAAIDTFEDKMPVITWYMPQNDTVVADNEIGIEACIESDSTVIAIEVFVNNQQFRGFRLASQTSCKDGIYQKIMLQSGENTVYVKVSNSAGTTISSTKKIVLDRPQKRLALVIGNANYQFSSVLPNPVNDATDMSAALSGLGFEVLTYTNTNFETMDNAFELFHNKLATFDVGLIFYAGHGIQLDGENYLIPVDAKLVSQSDVKYRCISVAAVIDRMNDYQKTNIILLDACRENPFKRNWKNTRSTTKTVGLASINAPVGTFIGFAASPGQTASDGNSRNGTYTEAILKNISSANESIDDIFTKVTKDVLISTEKQQVPWKSSSFPEKFYFTK